MVYPIPKLTLLPFTRLWIKKIHGLENVPKTGAFIIAANHTSYIDHFCLCNIVIPLRNQKLHFLAKKEHFDTLHQRIWHNYAGAIPLDRSAGGKKALRWAVKALREGKIIGIYPEGTRSLNGKIQKARTGIARLILASHAHVVPVGITGNFRIMPKGQYLPNFRRATVNIGHPLDFEKHYNKRITKKLLRKITTKIMKEIAKLSSQKYKG